MADCEGAPQAPIRALGFDQDASEVASVDRPRQAERMTGFENVCNVQSGAYWAQSGPMIVHRVHQLRSGKKSEL